MATVNLIPSPNRAANLLRAALLSALPGDGATRVGWLQFGTGAVARNMRSKIADMAVSPEDFGAVGDGVTVDTAAVQAAFNTGRNVDIAKTYLCGPLALNTVGQKVSGAGTIKSNGTGTLLDINAASVRIEDLAIDANGCLYGIFSDVQRTEIIRVRFSGNVGHYCFLVGDYNATQDCAVAPGFDQTIPFVQQGVGIRSTGHMLQDHTGFGIQFRFVRGGIMANNRSENPSYEASIVATSGQTVFNFTLANSKLQRFALLDDGNQRQATSVVNNNNGTYTVTFPVGSIVGHTVKLIGWRALETYQVNSECYDVIVANNRSDGTGDSCVVVAADYHDGVLDPANVDVDDYPDRIVVVGNVCRNSLAHGIGVLHCKAITVSGNNVSKFGFAFDPSVVNNTGINVRGALQSVTGENTVIGEAGRVQYGVSAWDDYVSGATPDMRDSGVQPRAKIGTNSFVGVFTSNYFSAIGFASTTRRFGVSVEGGKWIQYPDMQALFDAVQTVTGEVNSSPYWTYAVISGSAPADRDTVNKVGGLASVSIAATKTFEMAPSASAMFKNSLVKISFYAQAQGGVAGRLDIFYDNGTGSEPRFRVQVKSATWERYEIVIPVSALGAAGFKLRFGDSGAGAVTKFQHVNVQYQPLNLT